MTTYTKSTKPSVNLSEAKPGKGEGDSMNTSEIVAGLVKLMGAAKLEELQAMLGDREPEAKTISKTVTDPIYEFSRDGKTWERVSAVKVGELLADPTIYVRVHTSDGTRHLGKVRKGKESTGKYDFKIGGMGINAAQMYKLRSAKKGRWSKVDAVRGDQLLKTISKLREDGFKRFTLDDSVYPLSNKAIDGALIAIGLMTADPDPEIAADGLHLVLTVAPERDWTFFTIQTADGVKLDSEAYMVKLFGEEWRKVAKDLLHSGSIFYSPKRQAFCAKFAVSEGDLASLFLLSDKVAKVDATTIKDATALTRPDVSPANIPDAAGKADASKGDRDKVTKDYTATELLAAIERAQEHQAALMEKLAQLTAK